MYRLCITVAALPWLAAAQDYTKDIRPIFEKYCFGCHLTGVKMGAFELASYAELMRPGSHGQVVIAGDRAGSRLYQMVAGKIEPGMPMDGRKLSDAEVELIGKWIDAGAKGPTQPEPVATRSAAVPRIEPKVAPKPSIYSMAIAPDGKVLALGEFRKVVLKEAPNGADSAVLEGHAEAVRAVAFSSDGKTLAAAGGQPGLKGEVKVWDVATRKERLSFRGHSDCIYAAAISPDGKWLATASYDKLIKLWDLASGKEVRTLKDHIDSIYALVFTPDGARLLSGAADRTVKIWDPATGERLYTLGEPTDGINTVALSPDGKLVAAGGLDKSIRIWSLGEKSGKLLNTLIAHEDAILKLAWSPDGNTLISSSADRTIKVFRAADLFEIKTHSNQPDWVFGLTFTPDSRSFIAGRFDGSLTVYPVAQEAALARAQP
jgi:dipeptidyl aminopeptidase/acylaminoacyl peptidase